jgi:hypothetical protein
MLNVTGTGAVVVNSNANGALTNSGGGNITAPGGIDVTGTVTGGGSYSPNPPTTGTAPTPDPYSYLPTPSQPGTVNNWTKAKVNGITVYDLNPGTYNTSSSGNGKLPNFSNNDLVIFHQASSGNGGIYYLQSGGFNANGANIVEVGDSLLTQLGITRSPESGGIMIYNAGTGTNDGISITGGNSGTVNLSPLTGGTYQGMLIFQARNAPETVSITGQGNLFTLTGTIYAPDANIKLTGNGSASTIGSSVIGDTITTAGNGTVNVVYNSGGVLNQRTVTLVE